MKVPIPYHRDVAHADGAIPKPPWPAAAAGPAVVLLDAASRLEEQILRQWVDDHRPPGQAVETFAIAASRRRRSGAATSPAVIRRLEAGDDPFVFAVRVVWSPPERDGTRSARWTDLLKLGDPRDPGFVRQRVILTRRPDRMAIVVGEPVRASAALADHAAHPQHIDPVEFVTLRAWRSLERAERALRGNRYKVPKFVHEELTARPDFRAGAVSAGEAMGLDPEQSLGKAAAYLSEMAASHSTFLIDLIANAIHALYRQGYGEIRYDRADLAAIAALGHDHPIVFLPSHRSNMDRLALQYLLWENDLPPNHTAGGINMDFFPIGPLVRGTGVFFIRRSFKDNPLYKFVLQSYLDYLIENRFPLEWYLEGGRSRSGKLLPPRYGLLSYVVDSWRKDKAEDVMLVPLSISYDQIQDLSAYTDEAQGKAKEKETLGWVIKAVSSLRRRYGDIHVAFAEPLSLVKELGSVAGEGPDDLEIAKLGLEVMYRISRVTPITPASVVVIALLETEETPTVDEVGARCRSLQALIAAKRLPVTEELRLDDPAEVRRMLALLASHGNVTIDFESGSLPELSDDQILRVSYYRNAVVHHFLGRAVAEMALAGSGPLTPDALWAEVGRIRDLLKFEFFFPEKEAFKVAIEADLDAASPGWADSLDRPEAIAARLQPPVAGWAIAPFLEAYQVAADVLVEWEGELEEKQFLAACRRRGHAYRVEKRVSAASVSLPLFQQALGLARHRGLIEAGPEARAELATEVADALRRARSAVSPAQPAAAG
jgi:glycerol-3-phosphate O-acyltransferase